MIRTNNIFKIGIILFILILVILYFELTKPIKDLLSSFSSSLSDRSYEQKINISIGTNYINNRIIMPDEIFSFNQTVGQRSIKKGFLDAKAFMEGQLVSSIGGGICQLSSTLYAASLMAGLRIIKRVPHFYTVDSVPPGLDASVWYDKIDLVLQNTFSTPIKIHAFIENNILKISIWGTKNKLSCQNIATMENKNEIATPSARNDKVHFQEKECQILFSNKKIILPKIETIYTGSLKRGQRVVKKGRNGCYIKVMRKCKTAKNMSEELISDDFYKPYPVIVMIGK